MKKYKIVISVPESHSDKLREAIGKGTVRTVLAKFKRKKFKSLISFAF